MASKPSLSTVVYVFAPSTNPSKFNEARQVIGPIAPGEFVAADFEALQLYELRKRTGPVVEALINIYPEVNEYER